MSKIIFLGTCSGTEPMPNMHHSAIVIEKNNQYYWFDAGEGCSRSAHLMGIDLLKVRAVFITHPHMDHLGGLANLMWTIRKLTIISEARPIDRLVRVFMPKMDSWDGIMAILKETEENFVCDYDIAAQKIFDGVIFEDENIRVKACHNHHLSDDEGNGWQSFSFLIEVDGKRIVYSGDIRDQYDLDDIIGDGCDILLVETGHHRVRDICDYIAAKKVGRLYFTHHGREIINDRKGMEKILSEYSQEAYICSDGLIVEI